MPITRTIQVDDDGSGTTGTIWNNAWKQELYNQIDAVLLGGSGITANVVGVTTTGTVNNLACGNASLLTIILCSNAAPLTITGLSFTTPPRAGDLVFIQTVAGGGHLSLPYLSGASTHKFLNMVTSAPTPLCGGYGRALYIYQSANTWVLQQHDQGGWLTPAFNAADYGGSAGMTWTVTAGQVEDCSYCLQGRTLAWSVAVAGTVGGTVSPGLVRNIPGGFTAARTMYAPITATSAGAPTGTGQAKTVAANPQLTFIRDVVLAAWAAGAVTIWGSGSIEVS